MAMSDDVEAAIMSVIERARNEGMMLGRKQVVNALSRLFDSLLREPTMTTPTAKTDAVQPAPEIRVVRNTNVPAVAALREGGHKKALATLRADGQAIHHRGLHWTQKPENAAKLKSVVEKMNAGKNPEPKAKKVHWTQKPENAYILRRRARQMKAQWASKSAEEKRAHSMRIKQVWATRTPQKRAAIRRKQRAALAGK